MASNPYERGWQSVDDLDRPVISEEDISRQQAARRSRSLLRSGIRIGSLLLVLGGFGALVVYAYNWGTGEIAESQVPVVAADQTPEKEAPSERGGLTVPYQDALVLNETSKGQQVERIIPPPEEPMIVQPAEDPAPTVESAPATAKAVSDAEEAAASESSDPIASLIQMAELDAANTDAKGIADAPEEVAASEPPVAPAADPQTQQLAQVGQVSGFKVQLASLKTEDAARSEWARVQQANKDLLGGLKLDIQRVDLQDKGIFYRIQGGPLPSRETASDICAQLKGRGQPCIVVAP